MYVKTAKLTFRLPYVGSLKEKRHIARSLIEKAKNKFNSSISEVERHDSHGMLVIGLSLVAASEAHGQNCFDEIVRFMDDYIENNGHGELVEVEEW